MRTVLYYNTDTRLVISELLCLLKISKSKGVYYAFKNNKIFLKKVLAFHNNIAYNNTCVRQEKSSPDDKITSYALLAQLVEHLTLNQGVQGSSP